MSSKNKKKSNGVTVRVVDDPKEVRRLTQKMQEAGCQPMTMAELMAVITPNITPADIQIVQDE